MPSYNGACRESCVCHMLHTSPMQKIYRAQRSGRWSKLEDFGCLGVLQCEVADTTMKGTPILDFKPIEVLDDTCRKTNPHKDLEDGGGSLPAEHWATQDLEAAQFWEDQQSCTKRLGVWEGQAIDKYDDVVPHHRAFECFLCCLSSGQCQVSCTWLDGLADKPWLQLFIGLLAFGLGNCWTIPATGWGWAIKIHLPLLTLHR